MQELTFETILRLPQMELKKRLKAELKSRGYPVTDKPGYLYAEGTIPVLLVAHMDTVHRQPVEQICYSEDKAVAMSPQGIGGDDRCGVHSLLGELADRGLLVIADLLYRKHGILWFFVYSCLQTAKL